MNFKKALAAGFCFAMAGVLTSCGGGGGGSLCSRADTTATAVQSKVSGCASSGTTVSTIATTAQCNAAISHCNSQDQSTISSAFDCLNNMPNCTTATLSTWEGQYLACALPLIGLSASCQAAFPH